jgi:hypothetical protein
MIGRQTRLETRMHGGVGGLYIARKRLRIE